MNSQENTHIKKASEIMLNGGVIAYPTEGVFGLGCIPLNSEAVHRILKIKKRNVSAGLIVIASYFDQISDWVEISKEGVERILNEPDIVTWIVNKTDKVPSWVSGNHNSIAIRITKHPIASALCEVSDSPLISTSANISGEEPPVDETELRDNFGNIVDYIVPGKCNLKKGSSMIKILKNDEIIRPE